MTLWWKAWLELRWRFLLPMLLTPLCLWWLFPGTAGLILADPDVLARVRPRSAGFGLTLNLLSLVVWPLLAIAYAGAGINTQTGYAARHGVHPSMLFTLSLPVTRRRLLLVRAAAGLLAFLAVVSWQCGFAWLASPYFRAAVTAGQVALYVVCAVVASGVFYWLAVLLATFLDEMTVAYASFAAVWTVLVVRFAVPRFAAIDIFRGMGDLSYPMTGRMPWTALGVCAGISLALAAAALWVAERKEY